MTSTTNEAQGIESYIGTDLVMVGNISALPISIVGLVILPHTSITLSNVLVVPIYLEKFTISFSTHKG